MGDEIEQQEQEEIMELGPSLAAEPAAAPPPSPLPPPPHPPPLAPPSEAAALPSDAASKRQRRPNVRLNEIGDSSLANVVEYFLKRKGGGGGGDSKPTPPTTTAATAAPGKPSKKPKLSPKLKNDDVFHHAEDPKPRPSKPFEKRSLAPKSGSRKPGLSKSRYPDHSITVHSKHPRINRPRRYEGNGNSWMHKAMAGVADGFLEAADGGVYGCSDTDKHVRSRSPHDFEMHPAGSSFESDSPKGFRKIQAAKLKKKMGSGLKAPSAGYALKDEAEEKEEPSSSDVQELRLQGPVWERGVAALDDKVRDWIQGIGLEKYASVFQHHEVENDVLPLLTMDDLKEMGISAVGARRKLFSEIMKLRRGLMLVDDPLSDEK